MVIGIFTRKYMKKEITINKEWYDRLVVILDELNKQIEIDGSCVETHGWLSHLNGYVHSLDEYFKNY